MNERGNSMGKQFVVVGERIQYLSDFKGRSNTWPEGVWLENGIIGSVSEYHAESPAVIVAGELFEAIPPYAVVQFDNGASTCIDPEAENKRWKRAEGKTK